MERGVRKQYEQEKKEKAETSILAHHADAGSRWRTSTMSGSKLSQYDHQTPPSDVGVSKTAEW